MNVTDLRPSLENSLFRGFEGDSTIKVRGAHSLIGWLEGWIFRTGKDVRWLELCVPLAYFRIRAAGSEKIYSFTDQNIPMKINRPLVFLSVPRSVTLNTSLVSPCPHTHDLTEHTHCSVFLILFIQNNDATVYGYGIARNRL